MGATVMLIFFAPVLALYYVLAMFNPALAENVTLMITDSFIKFIKIPAVSNFIDEAFNAAFNFTDFLNSLR